MEDYISSDQHPTMLASNMFYRILNQIQSSNLNFQLQLSPFSAQISLKKSLVKDKSGTVLLPPPVPECVFNSNIKTENKDFTSADDEWKALVDQNIKLKNELFALQKSHEVVVNECADAHDTIESLKNHLRATVETVGGKSSETALEIDTLKEKIEALENKIKERDENLQELEVANKIAREGTNRIRKELNESKKKFTQEKAMIFKEHKSEVKAWRKELGEANREKIKLKEKLEDKNDEKITKTNSPILVNEPLISQLPRSEISCSICSEEIIDYKPKYFLGEIFNPACNKCEDSFEGDSSGPDPEGCHHSPVCVSRQPFPPPSPSITFLENEKSKYHEHMMSKYGAPSRYGGHDRCMNGSSNNYGCDSCVWFKWFGELHGFPDINPWDFKKYLETSEWAALGIN